MADRREDDATWTTVETEPVRGATSVVSAGTVVRVNVAEMTPAAGPSAVGMTGVVVGVTVLAVIGMTAVVVAAETVHTVGVMTAVVVAAETAPTVGVMTAVVVAGTVLTVIGTTGSGASRDPVTRSCPRTPMRACSTAA